MALQEQEWNEVVWKTVRASLCLSFSLSLSLSVCLCVCDCACVDASLAYLKYMRARTSSRPFWAIDEPSIPTPGCPSAAGLFRQRHHLRAGRGAFVGPIRGHRGLLAESYQCRGCAQGKEGGQTLVHVEARLFNAADCGCIAVISCLLVVVRRRPGACRIAVVMFLSMKAYAVVVASITPSCNSSYDYLTLNLRYRHISNIYHAYAYVIYTIFCIYNIYIYIYIGILFGEISFVYV